MQFEEQEITELVTLLRLGLKYDDLVKVVRSLKSDLTKNSTKQTKELAAAVKTLTQYTDKQQLANNKLLDGLHKTLSGEIASSLSSIPVPDLTALRKDFTAATQQIKAEINTDKYLTLIPKLKTLEDKLAALDKQLKVASFDEATIQSAVDKLSVELKAELDAEIRKHKKSSNDGPAFAAGARFLSKLSDVKFNNLQDADTISYDAATKQWQNVAPSSGTDTPTYEKVSKNLDSSPYVLNYTTGVLTSIVYTVTAGTITKTLNYTSEVLTSVVLSGDTPAGIDLTKTLSYTTGVLTGVTYS